LRNTIIARRYAKALFEISSERSILERVFAEIVSFEESLKANTNFRLFMNSQDVSKKEKQAKLEKALQDRISNVFFNFLLVLLRKNRETILSDIAREFQWMVDKRQKRMRAFATTAVPLDKKAVKNLKAALDTAFGYDIQLQNHVDESILGGVIVNVDGKLLDGSLKSQLAILKSQLIEKTNHK